MDEVNLLIEISKKMFIVMYFLDENYLNCDIKNTNTFLENFIKEDIDIYQIDKCKNQFQTHIQILSKLLYNYEEKVRFKKNNLDELKTVVRFKELLSDIKIR
tara:strand:- start:122 stop:427 length:306 start_codon:yes stop_codon:yes gene_type:complete